MDTRRARRGLAILAVAALWHGSVSAARTWTDSQGRKLEGDFVSLQGDMVTVKGADGKTRTVALSALSAADRQYVAQQAGTGTAPAAAAPAPAAGPAAKPTGRAPFLDKLGSVINGPTMAAIGDLAEIKLPASYVYVGAEDARTLLEAMGNPTNGSELGILAPENFDWFVVFEFDEIGYVKDDDKDALDAEKMLASIRKGNDAANKERQKRGWETLEIVGWAEAPNYDATTHNLQWAIRGRSKDGENINYNVRLLGRRGVMEACLVADPQQMTALVPLFKRALGTFSFKSGHRYGEYVSGDKIAKYGLAALVTGGAVAVAAKSGMLRHLWKLIVVGVAAVGGFFKRLFGGREQTR